MRSTECDREADAAYAVSARATALILGSGLLASALLPLPDPRGRILGLPSVCPFYEITGLPCPGCGMTRSFVTFAHGRILDAFHWNLLGPPLWLLFALFFVRAVVSLIFKRQVLAIGPTFARRASWGGLAALVVFGASRIAVLLIEHRRF